MISQQSRDKTKSENYSTLSTVFVNQAEKISMYDPMTMICKGFLFFAQGDYDNSEMYFSNISDNDKSSNLNKNLIILAKIGRGLNFYNKGNYNKALEYFVSLIRDYDYFNENVFECLGLCYYNLGNLKKAQDIFEKIIEMNPNNYRVQTYLSIISLVSSDYNLEDYQNSLQKIKDAFVNDENSDFHLLLIQLANIFLLSGKVNSAEEILNKLNLILEYGEMRSNLNKETRNKNEKYRKDLDEIKSSIYCINAKIQHFKKNNTEAFTHYIKAVQANPKNIEAQFGLGQIYLSMQNLTEAEKCFQLCKNIQANSSDRRIQAGKITNEKEISFDIIKYLAYIYARTRRKEVDSTIEMFKNALEINKDDSDCYIELAQLLEYKKPEDSLKYYEELLVLIKTKKDEVCNEERYVNYLYNIDEIMPEILNNIATIRIRINSFNDVDKLLNEAKILVKKQKEKISDNNVKLDSKEKLNKSGQNENMTKLNSLESSINFNFAIYYESNFQLGEAYKYYKLIIKENPFFIEAYIKLGLLAKLRGNKPKALEYMKQALEKHFEKPKEEQSNSKTNSNLHSQLNGRKLLPMMNKPIIPMLIMAQIHYDNSNENEALSILSNILKNYDDKDPYTLVLLGNIYYDMATQSRNKSSDFNSNLSRSLELYYRALESDKYNTYAAVGIANVLSEYNLTSYSIDTYKNVTEKFPNNHNAFVNEALICINENKFEKASIILTKLLKKFLKNKCPDIENLLAKSLIEMKDFNKAIKLQKGLILRYPDNIFYKFNYALCLKQRAEEILNKSERRVKETEEAIKYLEMALPIFESILMLKKEINQNLRTEKEEKIMKNNDFYYKCHEVNQFLRLFLTTARQILEKDRLKEQDTVRKIEENRLKYLRMLESQKEMDEKEREEIHRKMKENEKLAESYKHIAEQIIQVTTMEEKESKKNKKKRDKSFDDIMENERDYKEEEEVDYSYKREKKKLKKHKKNKKRRRENNSDSEDLIEIDEAYIDPHGNPEERKKHKKLKKRRRTVSEEDDEDFFGNFNDKIEDQKNLEEQPKHEEEDFNEIQKESYDNPNCNAEENIQRGSENEVKFDNLNIRDVEMKDYTKNELEDELDFS